MDRVRGWMQDAGLQTRGDALGNLAGRRGAGPRLVIGSHLDSVADAGRYDGILGVLVGLAVAEATDVAARGRRVRRRGGPALPVDVPRQPRRSSGSSTRASSTCATTTGSRLGDALGAPLGEPLFEGARAYFEVHIEQGPVLETEDAPLGVVTAIAGQTRFNVAFEGHAGHAGTTPMRLRRDALAAAAEFVLAAERAALAQPGLVATVGELGVPHGACNVIPGRVEATLDIRHQDDAIRARAIAALQARDGGDLRAARRSRRRGRRSTSTARRRAPPRWSPSWPTWSRRWHCRSANSPAAPGTSGHAWPR